MEYAQIRSQIKTGDIIAIHGRGLFPTLIRAVQKISGLGDLASITHVGVAWWIEGRLYIVEMDGLYNVLRPLSHHIQKREKISIFLCPVPVHAMVAQFESVTMKMFVYGLSDLVKIGLRMLFKYSNAKDRDERNLVCSTFVSRWLQQAGWKIPEQFPSMPSPAEVCRALGQAIWTITRS